MSSFDFDCAVVGGGPAGLVSGLYLGRYQRPTIIFNSGISRASWIPRTHNLLGYRGGISGRELLARLRSQVKDVGVETSEGECKIKKVKGGFLLENGRNACRVRKVILATGMQDVQPVIPNLNRMRRHGLLRYCPICDAYEYRDKPLVVLAQDDHGLKSALFVARFASQVDVVISEMQKPSKTLLNKCARAGIKIHRGRLQEIEKRHDKPGVWVHVDGVPKLKARACYVALGSVVNDAAFRNLQGLNRAEDGRLKVSSTQETGVPGLYAVGDCVEALAQIAVAAGSAAIAATQVHNSLRDELGD